MIRRIMRALKGVSNNEEIDVKAEVEALKVLVGIPPTPDGHTTDADGTVLSQWHLDKSLSLTLDQKQCKHEWGDLECDDGKSRFLDEYYMKTVWYELCKKCGARIEKVCVHLA